MSHEERGRLTRRAGVRIPQRLACSKTADASSRRKPQLSIQDLAKRVIQRYTRVNADTIEYSYAIDDPQTFVPPFAALREWTLDDSFELIPPMCHENNEGLAGILLAGRSDEAWAVRYAEAQARNRQRRIEEMKAE